jgi:chromate transporter
MFGANQLSTFYSKQNATARSDLQYRVDLLGGCYQSGLLVFGGGHVVLPMLHGSFVNDPKSANSDDARHGLFLQEEEFLAGYGAAQALPGPLFSFAAFLGSASEWGQERDASDIAALSMGLAATLFIFLPGYLIIASVMPVWQTLRSNKNIQCVFAGVNAAVVGMLLASLINPVIVSSVTDVLSCLIALTGTVLLLKTPLPSVGVVALMAASGFLLL